ncbi:AAA family ATPase [Amycolatopsis sp. FU40]|uniref:AAA family ATPase n=1 Tax=Amycolatopsis sp. FU40 TaxID=2914159 RepID=UPI001F26A1AD|nr:AAA family ATPase [Amycolatopsis sp. FU40]UKD58094.1 AAA family ATPase [Amycolatopsis sp. FU40]
MPIFLVTGVQAAGKSTVAQALAERLPESVHVRGDAFRRMVVNGRVEMGPADPPAEAVRQLRLRHALAAQVADGYADAGFAVVLQDIVLGEHLTEMVGALRTRPCYVVVLAPSAKVVAQREAARGKVAYQPGDTGIAGLDAYLREQTPHIGLWLDTSELTAEETVDRILARAEAEAAV